MYSAINLPFVGLNATPVAASKNSVIDALVVKLPYMGPSKLDDVIARPYPTDEYKLKSYQLRELGSDATRSPEYTDPCELLMQRTEQLAREHKCSEQEAEDMLFSRA